MNLTRTDGWRDGTGYHRQGGTVRWDRSLGGGQTLRTVAGFSRIDQQTAGSSSLGAEDYAQHPTANYTPISFRTVRAFRLSMAYERRGGRTLLSVTPFVRWNRMELLPNWSLSYDPTVYTTGHSSAGLLARYRIDLDPLRTRLIGGVDVDVSPGSRQEDAVQATRDGGIWRDWTRGGRLYDYDVTFRGVSPYVHAEMAPTERLHVTGGLRADFFGYAYDTRLDALQAGRHRRPADASVRYRHLGPKRQGLWYARSDDGGRSFGAPVALASGVHIPPSQVVFSVDGDDVLAAWEARRRIFIARITPDGTLVRAGDQGEGRLPALDGRMLTWHAGEFVRVAPIEAH